MFTSMCVNVCNNVAVLYIFQVNSGKGHDVAGKNVAPLNMIKVKKNLLLQINELKIF